MNKCKNCDYWRSVQGFGEPVKVCTRLVVTLDPLCQIMEYDQQMEEKRTLYHSVMPSSFSCSYFEKKKGPFQYADDNWGGAFQFVDPDTSEISQMAGDGICEWLNKLWEKRDAHG